MNKSPRKQINFRSDDELYGYIDWLRRRAPPPLPSIREIVRQALAEKVSRERESSKKAARR